MQRLGGVRGEVVLLNYNINNNNIEVLVYVFSNACMGVRVCAHTRIQGHAVKYLSATKILSKQHGTSNFSLIVLTSRNLVWLVLDLILHAFVSMHAVMCNQW